MSLGVERVAAQTLGSGACQHAWSSRGNPFVNVTELDIAFTPRGLATSLESSSRAQVQASHGLCDLGGEGNKTSAPQSRLWTVQQLGLADQEPHTGPGGLFASARVLTIAAVGLTADARLRLTAGAWRTFGPLTLTASVQATDAEIPVIHRQSVTTGNASKVVFPGCDTGCLILQPQTTTVDSLTGYEHRVVRELVVGASALAWGISLQARAGAGVGARDGGRRWALAEAKRHIGAGFDVVGAARVSTLSVSPSRSEVALSIRYRLHDFLSSRRVARTAAQKWTRMERTDVSCERRIVIHDEDASRMDVRGDFSGWTAVPLVARGNGDWVLLTHSCERLIHLVARADAMDWSVPPGLASVPDGFGLVVGVIVVPE